MVDGYVNVASLGHSQKRAMKTMSVSIQRELVHTDNDIDNSITADDKQNKNKNN